MVAFRRIERLQMPIERRQHPYYLVLPRVLEPYDILD